ncbi:inter-alpha-trypsin inhibitor heavy chain H3-like isoform X2 [Centropristis striata]|uniref:inter-alpha-trypsin inhibitor heavy chain H3-like isoform X2 n=1 Tax=Centropristis striata TaxID=184440 RepID=UPI0027DFFD05|nr:inter-alpha-trypsin inhibitor heavy chain H3-like isoform X2 [Centropristis striata]
MRRLFPLDRLLDWASGRNMETFSVSVNIAAKSNVSFILTYEELLQRKLGQYEILTRVKPKQPVQEFQIVVNIFEPQGIDFVEATATFLSNELLPLVEKTVTDTKAHISFSPTLEQQRKCPGCEGNIIDGDFIIKYDVKRAEDLGAVQIVSGYFVHFFAPPDLPRVPKNLVFVIDRSGSMGGRKIEQTRDALVVILKDLHEEDHFALILFDDSIVTWKDFLSKATKENVSKAIAYIRKLKDNGSTNINDAVLKAVTMLKREREKKNLPERSADMIILLTDGMPNHGESQIPKIQQNVRSAIRGKMTLFCLGFGNDVDFSFLDVMAKENNGLARRIFEGSDAAIQLQGFYEEVSSPLLLEVDLRYPDSAVGFLTKNHYSQLFNGTEIMVAGRLKENNLDNFLVEVFAQGPKEDFLVQGKASVVDLDVIYPEQEYISRDFSERLWAYLTIQQLLEKSEIGSQQEKENAKAKALDMSLQYSFVTPLTSMVVTKPETEDGPDSPLIADKMTEDERQQEERHGDMAIPMGIPMAKNFIWTDDEEMDSDYFYDREFAYNYPQNRDFYSVGPATIGAVSIVAVLVVSFVAVAVYCCWSKAKITKEQLRVNNTSTLSPATYVTVQSDHHQKSGETADDHLLGFRRVDSSADM